MENREVLLVLDDFAVCRKEDVLIYAGVKLPDVQLDEYFAVLSCCTQRSTVARAPSIPRPGMLP